jgi:nitroreductase
LFWSAVRRARRRRLDLVRAVRRGGRAPHAGKNATVRRHPSSLRPTRGLRRLHGWRVGKVGHHKGRQAISRRGIGWLGATVKRASLNSSCCCDPQSRSASHTRCFAALRAALVDYRRSRNLGLLPVIRSDVDHDRRRRREARRLRAPRRLAEGLQLPGRPRSRERHGRRDREPGQGPLHGSTPCAKQISGAPRRRRDVVAATASARWRGGSRRIPSLTG